MRKQIKKIIVYILKFKFFLEKKLFFMKRKTVLLLTSYAAYDEHIIKYYDALNLTNDRIKFYLLRSFFCKKIDVDGELA